MVDAGSSTWICEASLTGYRLVMGRSWCWIMELQPTPLDTIFSEIQRALEVKLYYLAIAVSLSIPDVCAALECDPNNIFVKEKDYVGWCERNLADQLDKLTLTAVDLYRLRGGVIHQNRFWILLRSSFGASIGLLCPGIHCGRSPVI